MEAVRPHERIPTAWPFSTARTADIIGAGRSTSPSRFMRCLTRADSARSTLCSSGAGAFAKVDSSAWGITTASTQHSAHAPAATAWCIATISDAPGKHWATSTPLPLPTATNPKWKNCPTAMCCFRVAFRADASSTFPLPQRAQRNRRLGTATGALAKREWRHQSAAKQHQR